MKFLDFFAKYSLFELNIPQSATQKTKKLCSTNHCVWRLTDRLIPTDFHSRELAQSFFFLFGWRGRGWGSFMGNLLTPAQSSAHESFMDWK
jgi:hypothetical protein